MDAMEGHATSAKEAPKGQGAIAGMKRAALYKFVDWLMADPVVNM